MFQRDDRRVMETQRPLLNYEQTVEFATGTHALWTSKIPRFAADGSVCGVIGFLEDITEQKLVEAEMAEADRLFRGTFEQAAVGIAHCDAAGNWLLANTLMCQIVGYSPDELLRTSFDSVSHEDDRHIVAEHLNDFQSGATKQRSWEQRFVRKDQKPVSVRLTASVAYVDDQIERLILVVEDINEKVESRRRMREAQEELRKLSLVAANVQHSVTITDTLGRIEWVNNAFVKMTGYSLHEVKGRRPGEFLQGEETNEETRRRLRDAIAERRPIAEEIINYDREGEPYWIRLEISPVFDDDGTLTNFIATQSDITARKREQAALLEATEAAEQANIAKSEFLANMSHEIRTPLSGILGFTELLIEDAGGEEHCFDHLRTIRASGRHLLELINSVLDLSKIEAGQLTVELIPCSPHAILAEVVSILRVRASEKGLTMDYEWEGPIPEQITTDPHRLRQMLMNLVGNAIKFTDHGRVDISAKVEGDKESALLRFAVRDGGVGIPEEQIKTIFDPFVQADSTVTRKFGGTGLGLPISRRIAEALGGYVRCQSVEGVGSCFTAAVETGDLSDVRMLDSTPEYSQGDLAGNSQSASLEGLRVLVADDGSTNRKLLRLLLTRAHALVETVENGQKAIEKASETEFDVVLMDMQMPVLDGYEATRQLRAGGYDRPIIAVTANAMKGDQTKCLRAGCSGYLSKPIDLGTLTRTLADVCADRGSAASVAVDAQPAEVVHGAVDCDESAYPCTIDIGVEDPQVREIVEEFLERLDPQIALMEEAAANDDRAELARLAHWLKGAGGTVGFSCFALPSNELETLATETVEDVTDVLSQIKTLAKAAKSSLDAPERCISNVEEPIG